MNKRYWYVLIIVVSLAAICIVEQVLVTKYFSNLETKITQLIEYVSEMDNINTPEVYDKVVEIETKWSDYEEKLCFLVNLKDIEDVGIELTKMKVYVVENNETEFKASLALLLYYIDGYYNFMGISFENIF